MTTGKKMTPLRFTVAAGFSLLAAGCQSTGETLRGYSPSPTLRSSESIPEGGAFIAPGGIAMVPRVNRNYDPGSGTYKDTTIGTMGIVGPVPNAVISCTVNVPVMSGPILDPQTGRIYSPQQIGNRVAPTPCASGAPYETPWGNYRAPRP